MEERPMIKKIFVLILFAAIIIPSSLYSKKKNPRENWSRGQWQNYISTAKTDGEKFNRLGEKIVLDLRERVELIIDNNQWAKLRLKDRHIYLLISFKELQIQEFADFKTKGKIRMDKIFHMEDRYDARLKLEAYDLVAGAIKSAIEDDRKLRDHVSILSINTNALKKAIMETEDPIYNQEGRLKLKKFQALNANYVCNFIVNKRKRKFVFNNGHANIVEVGHAIGHTANFELQTDDLFEKYKSIIFAETNKIEPLETPVTWYRPDENARWVSISPGTAVKSGGQISFEIQLPSLAGYLLIYLQDSKGNYYNLFPGTRKALENQRYKVPDDLFYPPTKVLKETAMGTKSEFKRLDTGKIQTAVYTFDDSPGAETFYFYYMGQPNSRLESFLKGARETGNNLPEVKTKGVNRETAAYSGKKIKKNTFHHKTLQMTFKHE